MFFYFNNYLNVLCFVLSVYFMFVQNNSVSFALGINFCYPHAMYFYLYKKYVCIDMYTNLSYTQNI